MSTETKFYCDCCKKEIGPDYDMGKVILVCGGPMFQRTVADDPYYFTGHRYDLCSDCRLKVWEKIRAIFEEEEE